MESTAFPSWFDWFTLVAIVMGPILAVQAEKSLERLREKRKKRERIFYTLMAHRAAKVSPARVQALNEIDLEFSDKREPSRRIREAWAQYRDHLNSPSSQEELKHWLEKGDDLHVDLLYEMSTALGYGFDKVQLKKGIYAPVAHSDHEIAENKIRDGLVAVLEGNRAIPISGFPKGQS